MEFIVLGFVLSIPVAGVYTFFTAIGWDFFANAFLILVALVAGAAVAGVIFRRAIKEIFG